MKYKYNLYISIFSWLCTAMLISCDEYLGIEPKGKTTLVTVEHYDQWLDDGVLRYVPSSLEYLSDLQDEPSIVIPTTNANLLAYLWSEYYNTEGAASFWADHYENINKYNTVLVGIDDATEGTEEEKLSLKAEALLGRAFEYLYLVNEYGSVYDDATADEDLAVPFVTSNSVGDPIPDRATVSEIYTHIITDIEAAIPDLPIDNRDNRIRGSVAAGYSVLSRVYLYMGDYNSAAANAQQAMDKTSAAMLDFNEPYPVASDGLVASRPDAIYARAFGYNRAASNDFMQTFDLDDLRLSLFYGNNDGWTFTERGSTYIRNTSSFPMNRGTSVQEMKLIIAEAAVREGDLTTALQQLNEIRMLRFSEDNYEALVSDDQETVFDWVIRERKFEFAFNGLRWFDMRRLANEGRMPTVYRYDGEGNIIATLEPNSPKYTLQIPAQILKYHPDWSPNPWEE